MTSCRSALFLWSHILVVLYYWDPPLCSNDKNEPHRWYLFSVRVCQIRMDLTDGIYSVLVCVRWLRNSFSHWLWEMEPIFLWMGKLGLGRKPKTNHKFPMILQLLCGATKAFANQNSVPFPVASSLRAVSQTSGVWIFKNQGKLKANVCLSSPRSVIVAAFFGKTCCWIKIHSAVPVGSLLTNSKWDSCSLLKPFFFWIDVFCPH